LSGGNAYVADASYGLRIINVSNPASPIEVGFYDTPDFACCVAVSGNYIYVTDGNAGLRIYQYYSSPSSIQLSHLSAIQASETGIFVNWRTESEDECLCYKIERSLVADNGYSEIGMVQGNGTTSTAHDYSFIDSGIKASGTYYYRLAQIDLSGERTYYGPVQVDLLLGWEKEADQLSVHVVGNTVEYTIGRQGSVSLNVYNLLGQEVRNLVRENKTAGSYKINWNGRDNSGRRVSSGVYLVRLEAQGQTATGKLLVVR
jgi:hypothetical protein